MAQLTTRERDLGAIILIALSILGIAMAAAGRNDLLGIHGAMVLLYSLVLLFVLLSGAFGPPPSPGRLTRYYDDPIKIGVGLTLFWAIFGMFIGVWAAAQLAWPSLNFRYVLGELRPDPARAYFRRHFRLRGNA